MVPYAEVLAFVQHTAPTWCKTQQVNFAQLIGALLERENLALSDLAHAWPAPQQPLHGRLKRLVRFLDNPRLAAEMSRHAAADALGYRWSMTAARLRRLYADLEARQLVECS